MLYNGLNNFVFFFFITEAAFAVSYLLQGAQISDRMILIPILNSSAYLLTVLLYCGLGLFLYQRMKWKAILPIGVMGAIHDLSWNAVYSVLFNPAFPKIATAAQPLWPVYIGLLAAGAPVFWFLQSSYLHPRYRITLMTFLFPLYVVNFYIIAPFLHLVETSEPTFLIIGNLYILTLFASYLGTVKFPDQA